MGPLLERLLSDSNVRAAATPATLATNAPKVAESQLSQGPPIRTWAQWDGRRWHGVAVGPDWWQWCGSYWTLAQALQAAERAEP